MGTTCNSDRARVSVCIDPGRLKDADASPENRTTEVLPRLVHLLYPGGSVAAARLDYFLIGASFCHALGLGCAFDLLNAISN
jgi:hypothetical protein